MDIRLTATVRDTGTVVQADGRLSGMGVAELESVVLMTSGPVTLDLTNLLSADDAGWRPCAASRVEDPRDLR